jgi:peptidoglycan hydrolase-like protein with peptidoglycan-binding domain
MKLRSVVLATAVSLSLGAVAYAQQGEDPAAEQPEKATQPQGQGKRMQMSAEMVRQVQQQLNDKGHDAGPVDGIFGKRTRKALKDFQKAEGMQPTGKLDAETMAALGVEDASSASSEQPSDAASSRSPSSQSPGTPTDRNHPAAQGGDAGQGAAGGQQSQ